MNDDDYCFGKWGNMLSRMFGVSPGMVAYGKHLEIPMAQGT